MRRLLLPVMASIGGVCLIALVIPLIIGRWVPEGDKIAYMATDSWYNWDIYLLDVDRRLSQKLVGGEQYERYPSWSPDGRYLTYHSNQRGTYDLYIRDMQTGETRRMPLSIRSQSYNEAMPQWTPDGETIAFHANEGGMYNIYLTDIDGEIQNQVTFNQLGNAIRLMWSPDGSQAVYAADDETGVMNLYIVDTDDLLNNRPGNPLPGTPMTGETYSDSWFPAWSPDGEQILFISRDTGDADVYIMNTDGSNVRNLTNSIGVEETQPAWTPDGRIIFSANYRGSQDLWMMNADGSNLRRLTFDDNAAEEAPAYQP